MQGVFVEIAFCTVFEAKRIYKKKKKSGEDYTIVRPEFSYYGKQ